MAKAKQAAPVAQGQGQVQAEAARASAHRTEYVFTVPPTARVWSTDPGTITMVELTFNEEQAASQAAKSHGRNAIYSLATRSVVAFDGKPLTWEANERERAIESCGPKVRALILQAFQKLHAPEDKGEVDSFLESMTVQA
jgi:hypothetical protein